MQYLPHWLSVETSPHSTPLLLVQCVVSDPLCTYSLFYAEHTRYLGEVAIAPIPANIEPLLRVLQAQGNELVSPSARRGLHPLLIPLAQGPVSQSDTPNAALRGGEAFTCLLRWAEPSTTNNLPVVRMSANSPAMVLVARSADEYLHR